MCLKIKISEIRFNKNVSVRRLSILSGIPRATLSAMENGRYYPNIKHLELIAKALNVKMSDLYDSPYK
ncbi:helix-turn-helix transcriptional regulator [Thomasclavelia cocleata]|uniref:helix-turn-helix transcriptional regulator n=1 Tax=Thomasclavelia cocleata TaxID=69824 RepID=UPI00242D4BE2|nr:helix-turn-helix transcriptional regulator [Thomasclavelia cocleata]